MELRSKALSRQGEVSPAPTNEQLEETVTPPLSPHSEESAGGNTPTMEALFEELADKERALFELREGVPEAQPHELRPTQLELRSLKLKAIDIISTLNARLREDGRAEICLQEKLTPFYATAKQLSQRRMQVDPSYTPSVSGISTTRSDNASETTVKDMNDHTSEVTGQGTPEALPNTTTPRPSPSDCRANTVTPTSVASYHTPPPHMVASPMNPYEPPSTTKPPHYSTPNPLNPLVGREFPNRSLDPSANYLLTSYLYRPPAEPFTGGDKGPSFEDWKRSLQNNIAGLQLLPWQQLEVMCIHSGGTPHLIVKDFYRSTEATPLTVDRAWQDLSDRYGQEEHKLRYVTNRIVNFQKIKSTTDKEEMGRLFDLCRLIMVRMDDLPQLSKYDYPENQVTLWNKLPDALLIRWRAYGMSAKTSGEGRRKPDLSTFVNFLKEINTELHDDFFNSVPVYPAQLARANQMWKPEDKPSVARPKASYSMASHGSPKIRCPLHESAQHDLKECQKFKNLTYDIRKDVIRKNNRCFKCFGSHMAKNCQEKVECNTCGGGHHILLHDPKPRQDKISQQNHRGPIKSLHTTTNRGVSKYSKTLLVHVRSIHNKEQVLTGYCIIDGESNDSFVDPRVPQELNLSGPEDTYRLRTLEGIGNPHNSRVITGVEVRGVAENQWFTLPPLMTSDQIPDTRDEVATPQIVGRYKHLAHVKHYFHDLREEIPVLMLLGASTEELMHAHFEGERSPYAVKTRLGWAMSGVERQDLMIDHDRETDAVDVTAEDNPRLGLTPADSPEEKAFGDIFKEYKDDDLPGLSKEEQQFLKIMDTETIVEGKRITMPLPFRHEKVTFPDNKAPVYHRTKTALDKLKKEPLKLSQCLQGMEKNIQNDHVEEVPYEEYHAYDERPEYFTAVFPVTHAKKGTARIVFDAAAQYFGESLNKKLLQGPNNMKKLKGILWNFRINPIGITCDIEHMFYNFGVIKEQRDCLRFFWYRNNDPKEVLVQYRAKVHIFGACSSPAVAAYGLRYAAKHSSLPNCEKVQSFVTDSFYVDDGITSVKSVEEAVGILLRAKEMLQEFGIRIHKFASSHPDVMKSLPKEDVAESLTDVEFEESPNQRTLGVTWNIVSDTFVTKADIPETAFTKRGILSAVNSFYDPIGVATPLILTARLIQRKVLPPKIESSPELELCGWDSPLPTRYLPMWLDWKESLKDVHLIQIPRCYVPKEFGTISKQELHVFADASSQAIGVVIYVRSYNTDGDIHVSFLSGSSRVAPHSITTIPRLELNAAVQAIKMTTEIQHELKISFQSVVFYTDSQVVMGYLKNKKRNFTRYVTRRVETVLKISNDEQWNYVTTEENPADLATRPTDPVTLSESIWLTGPRFLTNGESAPGLEVDLDTIDLPETVKEIRTLITSTIETSHPFTSVFNRISSWVKVLSIVKIVFSFVLKISPNVNLQTKSLLKSPDTEASSREATCLILRLIQREKHPDVISRLERGEPLSETHPLTNLSPFLDGQGLIRVGGRIRNADAPFDCKHPILVPANHQVSTSLLLHLHNQAGHQGRLITHGHIRQQGYHLERGRQDIRQLLSVCVTCRRLRGQPCQQMMADLPPDRLESCPPFTNCGLDVFGPFSIHDGINTRRNTATKKIFVVIFNCLATRAVHLEPIPLMDTSSLQNALRRFLALRGMCKLLRSDHGTNFIGTINQIKEAKVDFKAIQREVEYHDCEWKLNPPGASHFGGPWERKIGAVRRVLENSLLQLGNQILSRDEMHTLLQEAAAIVNSTPLYGITTDPNDPCPISPNNLLTLKDSPHPPPVENFSEADLLSYGKKRWRRTQYLADQFWTRWRRHYLQELQRRTKWKRARENLGVGDVVLVRSKNSARCQWPTAVITSVKNSDDKLVRSVKLKMCGKERVMERCIHDLILLMKKE